ncbi:MAG: M81 family metallopeptidase [Gammaproteobacteria bacterium]|nr:M81 family metallopeptidase [Gammaproteobacteria bacterium]
MRIFLAGFLTETNTYSPIPTTLKDFRRCYFTDQFVADEIFYWDAPLYNFAKKAEALGWQCIRGRCAVAMPAGPVIQRDYEIIRDEILHSLQQAAPVDIVFLHLHGAMVAQNCFDCEGDILTRVRQQVGPNAIIAALFDPHSHLTETMMAAADILVWMKEYPHIDGLARSDEIFTMIEKMVEHKIKPVISYYDCQTIAILPTVDGAMKGFVAQMKAIESSDPAILSISLIHGFPWGDVPDMGTKLLVISDNQPQLGDKIAKQLGQILKKEIIPQTPTTTISLDEAMVKCRDHHSDQPLVLADFADNSGGGAPGDSTFILQALLDNEISHFALSALWDPVAVEIAIAAGEGARLPLWLGGKLGRFSADPIDLTVKVSKIVAAMRVPLGDEMTVFGNAVALSLEEIDADIVIHDQHCQTYALECFSHLGIDPARKRVLVVKSSNHFRAAFAKISSEIYLVATDGALNPDLSKLHYSHATNYLSSNHGR